MNPARCLLLLLSLPLAGQPSPPAAVVAERLAGQIQVVQWDKPYAAWQRANHDAGCRQFPDDEGWYVPNELWCYRCAQANQAGRAEWLFYAFSLDEPVVARLEQFRAFVAGPTEAALAEIHRELAKRLDAAYGASDDPGQVFAFGSAFWRDVRRWRTADLLIYAYLNDEHGKPLRLELLARHRHLIEALAADQRSQDASLGQGRAGTALDQRLGRELGPPFRKDLPDLPALLAREQPQQDQAALRPVLLRLLESAKAAPRERRPVLLLAADRLADRLLITERQSPPWEQERKQLAGYGLTYQWDELSGAWHYRHDLLWLVWDHYGATEWGEQAFLLLQSHGWDTSVGCRNGSDQFREVIRRGEEFLAQRPLSPHRLEALLAVAEAYETAWSLSLAKPGDDYVDAAKYQEGADAARRKAIELYERLLRLAPAGEQAAYARRELPRLQLGIDTAQHRFYCIYD